jgi:peroxiredoxin
VDCHRLTLEKPDGSAELWIAKGERPWLMRHRTEAPEAPKMPDKDESGTMVLSFMPGFDIRFTDWMADPDLAGAFEIRPDEGFTRAETLYPPPEEMASLMGSMVGPDGFGGEHPSVGQPAPEVGIQPVDGEAVALSSLKGKVVVLDFWASWCKPCVIELPLVAKVTDERADQGVVFYAVNTGESASTVAKFLESRDLDVPLVLDDDGVIASAYGVGALPHLVIIDPEGTVRHVHRGSGPGTQQRLETELDELLSN